MKQVIDRSRRFVTVGAVAVLLICAMTPQANAQPAAGLALLERPARLDVRGVTREVALYELWQRSGAPLAFSPDLVNGNELVSCSCLNVTVREALDSLLAGTALDYRDTTNRVMVTPGTGSVEYRRQTAAQQQTAPQAVTLTGEVRSAADSQPVVGAFVRISGRVDDIRTDGRGRFRLSLREGLYDVTVRAVGYGSTRVTNVRVAADRTDPVIVLMEPATIRLADIVVSPSTYAILDVGDVVTQQTLTREDIRTRPGFGEDIYRAMHRLPGVATDDISAKIHIRGSPNDQVLETLDGLEMYEPFHLKEIDGGFSIIDIESVNDVDLMTGGFGAEYGDKLAGVFAMRTQTPEDRTTNTLGLSLQNVSFKTEGGFAGGKGRWLASGRRGYLDVILAITDATDPGVELSPVYYDAFGKVQFQLNANHLLSAHVLHAGDDFSIVEEDLTELESGYKSSYGWVNWHAGFTSALSAQTMLSVGRVNRRRDGRDFVDNGTLQNLLVADDRVFEFFGAKQDWSLAAGDRWLVKWGADFKRGSAEYDYFRWYTSFPLNTTNPFAPPFGSETDTVAVSADLTGNEVGLYLANRLQPVDAVTTEIGVRYDYHSHTGEETVSPRVNAAIDIASHTTLRAAWGYFYQAHGLSELMTADGDATFYPAQRAEHRVLALEHRLGDGTSLRVEGYERLVSDPRPEYRNLEPQYETVWEEGPTDRIRIAPTRSEARGLEFMVKHDVGGRFAWSASYALAWAEDRVDGEWLPRPYDQRHTVRIDAAYRPSPRWSLSWAWQYHSGWPITPQAFDTFTAANGDVFFGTTFGPLYSERLPAYHRLDVRAARHFPLGRGRLLLFLDIFNLYDRDNAKAFDYWLSPVGVNRFESRRGHHALIGILPTIGVRWEF